MSDFDVVLERLLTDPSFPARLAADPAGALAGYDLDAAETDLLRQQVSSDAGASTAAVEDRVTKSSTFGLFSSFGFGGGTDAGAAREGFGDAPRGLPAVSAFGDAPRGLPAVSALGDAPRGLPAVSGFGDAPRSGLGEPEHLAPPKGYHNRVDADGDGRLDRATYRGRAGGGAEIRVDLDGDGRADFVGVDQDLDNRVDFADYDKDHDGVFDKRMIDDDGDGFLDRTVLPQEPRG